ncbi:probable folate-biopterin transporter 4 [Tanacetum coccineum]
MKGNNQPSCGYVSSETLQFFRRNLRKVKNETILSALREMDLCIPNGRILSDCIPIKGRKRIPYLVIATLLSLFPWVIVGLQESVRNSRNQLMVFLLLQNLGSAMADVVIDAMIAEAARLEKAKFAGDLQSVSWMAMALGGICGSLLGGYALINFQMENIFLLFAVLPMAQLLSCTFVKESPVSSNTSPKDSGFDGLNGSISDENESSNQMRKTNSLRRKKSSKQKKKRKVNRSKDQMPEKDRSFMSQLLQSLKMAGFTLFKAFRQPIIMRPNWALVFPGQGDNAKSLNSHVLLPNRRVLTWFMPFLILSGHLCPPGIEGTLFALFMSINNLGATIGAFLGAGLASVLNISSGSFDNLSLGIAIQVICTFIPVCFLFLIPKETTGISA